MKHPWITIFAMILAGFFLWFGWLSLTVDVTTYSLWWIVAYSPWFYIPINILFINLLFVLHGGHVKESMPSPHHILDMIREVQWLGWLYKFIYFLFIVTGGLFATSSYVSIAYGFVFMIYGILGILIVNSLQHYNEEKDIVEWE